MNEQALLDAMKEEVAREERASAERGSVRVYLNITQAVAICANLQLAMRHPLNLGPSRSLAQQFVDGVARELASLGYATHAQIVHLGNDQKFDVCRSVMSPTVRSAQ